MKVTVSERSPRSRDSVQIKKSEVPLQHGLRNIKNIKHFPDLTFKNQPNQISPERSPGKGSNGCNQVSGLRGKRVVCPKCGEYILKRVIRLHTKYYCGKQFLEKEWKVASSLALCLRCHKNQEPESIEFHVKYLCGKIPITVQCFYCPRLFQDYKFLLKHMNTAHKKRHCFLDLISVLPVADSVDSDNPAPKIVKNFFSNMLNTEQEAVVTENDPCVQLRNKANHKCETCGKVLMGTHEYVNHVNTKCESEKHYFCFYCAFKSILAYEVLDHMEDSHGKLFNTFDIIQARLTGIIPLIEQHVSDRVSNSTDPPESKTGLFPKNVVKRVETPRLEIISKPILSKKKESVGNVPLAVNGGAEQSDTVNDQMLENSDLSVEELTVMDKHIKIESTDSPEDLATETVRKWDKVDFNIPPCDLHDKQMVNLSGSQGNMSVDFTMADKVYVDESRGNLTEKYLSEETTLVDSNQVPSNGHLLGSIPSNGHLLGSIPSSIEYSKLTGKENRTNDLSAKLLPENNTVLEEMADEVMVGKSPIECISQYIFKPSFSPRKSREVKTNQESKSPEGITTKKPQKVVSFDEDECLMEDPELDFANKQLFEPYISLAGGSQSVRNQVTNLKSNNKLAMEQFIEKSCKEENGIGGSMSSDSEVDFANKELFEPYATPKKDKRSPCHIDSNNIEENNKIDSLRKKVRSSVSYSSQTSSKKKSSNRGGEKETNSPIKNRSAIASSATNPVVRNKKKLKRNKMAQNTMHKKKASLKVTKRRIIIGKKIIKATSHKSKRSTICKINCEKCHKDVHPGDFRIHNKYHCLKEPTKNQWILHSGKALCLKCRKFQWSDGIDFHVKYVCNRKKFSLQCLYCSKIGKDFKSVIVHMRAAHGKKHYYQDFMAILPDPEVGSPEKTPQAEFMEGERGPTKTFKHPTTFYTPKKIEGGSNEEMFEDFVVFTGDYYKCHYCEFKHSMAYKTLDHMEDIHSKTHNLYDLLYAKLPTSEQEKAVNSGGLAS